MLCYDNKATIEHIKALVRKSIFEILGDLNITTNLLAQKGVRSEELNGNEKRNVFVSMTTQAKFDGSIEEIIKYRRKLSKPQKNGRKFCSRSKSFHQSVKFFYLLGVNE